MIQFVQHMECRKPDVVVVEKEEKKCLIVDIAIPDDKKCWSERRGEYLEVRRAKMEN